MPKVRKVPARTCVACQRVRPKRELLRIVRLPSGEVKVDPTGKLAGRGAYVCPESGCIDAGLSGRRLQHALDVPIPDTAAQALRETVLAHVRSTSVR